MDFRNSFKKKDLKSKPYHQEPILSKHHHYTASMSSSGDSPMLTCPSPAESRTTMSASSDEEEEDQENPTRAKTNSRLLKGRVRTGPLKEEEDETEEDPLWDEDILDKYKRTRFSSLNIFQWVSLVFILVILICTFFVSHLKRIDIKGFSLWKWEIVSLVFISGRLISGWGIKIIVLLIERNFLLRKRVLYFVYGLRNPVQNSLWLGVGLITWHLLIGGGEKGSKCLEFLTRILVCFFVGTFVWLIKTLLVKVLASLFHVSRFFDRIHDSVFNQYVIDALTGPPIFETSVVDEVDDLIYSTSGQKLFEMQSDREINMGEKDCHFGKRLFRKLKRTRGRKFTKMQKVWDIEEGDDLDFKNEIIKLRKTKSQKEEGILLDRLDRISSKNVSAWSMKRLIKIIKRGFYYTLDEQILDATREDEATQKIESEFEAKIAAMKIFRNVAQKESKFIYLEDVARFMRDDQALKTMNLLGGSQKIEKISKSMLKNWVINAVRERRALALTLDDTKTAVNTLHQMVNVLVSIIIAIAWFLILGFLTTKFLLLISSHIVVAAFMFGNSCKIVFESIIFLFVIHPFDVGDRCEINGVQMVVEEMNILSTVFLKFDNQKIIYPNSFLSTIPISNYNRSPDMSDTIDFSVHIATPFEKVPIMKQRIISYIESKKEYWHPCPTIVLMDIEELTKIKFSLWLTHRMNYQDITEKWKRRSLVLEEMIKIFNELDIEYRCPPVDVNVISMPQLSNSR